MAKSCENLSHLKKYRERPSPPYPAGGCPGKTKKGNDGTMFKSKRMPIGTYRWIRVKSSARTRSRSTTRPKSSKRSKRAKVSKRW